jgi:hypothetical protein
MYISNVIAIRVILAVLGSGVAGLAAEGTNAPVAAVSTNSPVVATNAVEHTVAADSKAPTRGGTSDYAAFKIIADRNIFDPNRSSRSARTRPSETPKTVKVETFSLVGTMSYAMGDTAFFNSASSQFRKAAKRDESIAGYKIAEILQNTVKLELDGKTIEMTVGAQMKREDDGPWKLIASRLNLANVEKSGDGAAAGSGGEDDEVLKRLLLRKQQEEK